MANSIVKPKVAMIIPYFGKVGECIWNILILKK